ncbi:protein NTM1-like 9 [Amaranthus tricolor]|uniref:protein NTM1-like 9 n=1 Tax=Amaranthus tricolor TaxID=29722 RepID=UPI00258FAA20|nr:protein NTM1-like 9 [Amaranthus tricolor]
MPFEDLPLGFRFKPTDSELIDHYLRLKINGKESEVSCIREVDICRVEPWDLPAMSAIKTKDLEWFFFCPRDRKYPNGQRSNRATTAGYWKATGKDRSIKSKKMGLIGMKKTLVFYTGRAPKGQRTHWVIHEYRPTLRELDGSHPGQGAFVLCRLFKKADEVKLEDNDDGSHTDEVEPNIDSPNPTYITQDIRSEPAVTQASPLSVEQSVEQRIATQNPAVKPSNSLASETAFPERPVLNEETMAEVNSHFIKSDHFDDFLFDKLGLHENQGPGWMDDIFSQEIGDGLNVWPLQDINVKDPFSHLFDSLIDTDAPDYKKAIYQGAVNADNDMWKNSSIKEGGSCSGSDVELAQQQHDVGFVRDGKNIDEQTYNKDSFEDHLWNDNDVFSDASLYRFCNSQSTSEPSYYAPPLSASSVKTEDITQFVGNREIQIRSRGRQLPQPNFNVQGTAPRRIRFEKGHNSTVIEDGTIPPFEDILCLEDLTENVDEPGSSTDANEVVETGIEIKTRHLKSQPGVSIFMEQGTAPRILRLEANKQSAFCADATRTLSEEINDEKYSDQKSISSKIPMAVPVVKVVMVISFFIVCCAVWVGRNVFLLSS